MCDSLTHGKERFNESFIIYNLAKENVCGINNIGKCNFCQALWSAVTIGQADNHHKSEEFWEEKIKVS